MLHLYLLIYTHAYELLFDWFFHHNGLVILITGGVMSFLVVKYCNNRRAQNHYKNRIALKVNDPWSLSSSK
jgi:Cu2+-containing amine oxidase